MLVLSVCESVLFAGSAESSFYKNRAQFDWVHFLWKGTMKLPGGRPAGREVQVTFSFDENGIMHCSFEDMESGRKDEIDLDNNNSDNNSDNNSGSSGSAPIDIEQFKIE